MSVPSNDLMKNPPSWSARTESFRYLHIPDIPDKTIRESKERNVPSCHERMN